MLGRGGWEGIEGSCNKIMQGTQLPRSPPTDLLEVMPTTHHTTCHTTHHPPLKRERCHYYIDTEPHMEEQQHARRGGGGGSGGRGVSRRCLCRHRCGGGRIVRAVKTVVWRVCVNASPQNTTTPHDRHRSCMLCRHAAVFLQTGCKPKKEYRIMHNNTGNNNNRSENETTPQAC